MAIESADFITQLVITNPTGGDQRTTSDDHHRLIKKAITQTFPNLNSECSASPGEMNYLVGLTGNIQTQIDDLSAAYHSAIAVSSASLDTKIDTLSAQLSTTSASLDAKIETLSAALSTTSSGLQTQIDAISSSFVNIDALGVLALHKTLAIVNNTTNPTYQIDIDADSVILTDASYDQYRADSVNLTVDLTVSGANGLDAGSEANLTWYHLWVIYNGSTVAGLLSTSATAPTMPSGYTYKGYVGAIYNDSGGDFINISQRNFSVACEPVIDVNAGTAVAYTSVTVTAPSTATTLHGYLQADEASGDIAGIDVALDSTTQAGLIGLLSRADGATYVTIRAPFRMRIENSTLYYKKAFGDTVNLITSGWEY